MNAPAIIANHHDRAAPPRMARLDKTHTRTLYPAAHHPARRYRMGQRYKSNGPTTIGGSNMAKPRNSNTRPIINVIVAVILAITGIALCTGRRDYHPEPSPSPSMSTSFPPQIEGQP
jgi:hypothetical protein